MSGVSEALHPDGAPQETSEGSPQRRHSQAQQDQLSPSASMASSVEQWFDARAIVGREQDV